MGTETDKFFLFKLLLSQPNSNQNSISIKAKESEGEQAVKDAIDAGYRHIDSAFAYENEKVVGNGVRAKIDEGVIKREEIFITTKVITNRGKRRNEFFIPFLFSVMEYIPRA